MPLTEGCRRSRPLRGLKAQRRQPPCAGGGQPRCTERERRCTKRERMYRERGRRCTQVQVLYICIVCMYHVYVYRDFICLLNGTAAASPHWSRALRCRKMLRSLAGGGGGQVCHRLLPLCLAHPSTVCSSPFHHYSAAMRGGGRLGFGQHASPESRREKERDREVESEPPSADAENLAREIKRRSIVSIVERACILHILYSVYTQFAK